LEAVTTWGNIPKETEKDVSKPEIKIKIKPNRKVDVSDPLFERVGATFRLV